MLKCPSPLHFVRLNAISTRRFIQTRPAMGPENKIILLRSRSMYDKYNNESIDSVKKEVKNYRSWLWAMYPKVESVNNCNKYELVNGEVGYLAEKSEFRKRLEIVSTPILLNETRPSEESIINLLEVIDDFRGIEYCFKVFRLMASMGCRPSENISASFFAAVMRVTAKSGGSAVDKCKKILEEVLRPGNLNTICFDPQSITKLLLSASQVRFKVNDTAAKQQASSAKWIQFIVSFIHQNAPFEMFKDSDRNLISYGMLSFLTSYYIVPTDESPEFTFPVNGTTYSDRLFKWCTEVTKPMGTYNDSFCITLCSFIEISLNKTRSLPSLVTKFNRPCFQIYSAYADYLKTGNYSILEETINSNTQMTDKLESFAEKEAVKRSLDYVQQSYQEKKSTP